MDSEKESCVSMMAPCMPPPPPPPPMLNINAMNDGRSQLLADIRKGSSLKKTPVMNDSSVSIKNENNKNWHKTEITFTNCLIQRSKTVFWVANISEIGMINFIIASINF